MISFSSLIFVSVQAYSAIFDPGAVAIGSFTACITSAGIRHSRGTSVEWTCRLDLALLSWDSMERHQNTIKTSVWLSVTVWWPRRISVHWQHQSLQPSARKELWKVEYIRRVEILAESANSGLRASEYVEQIESLAFRHSLVKNMARELFLTLRDCPPSSFLLFYIVIWV